jgi:hypothetical protein
MTILTQLEYDLKELDLLNPKKPAESSPVENVNYVTAQKTLIEEFAIFLKKEIDFVDQG